MAKALLRGAATPAQFTARAAREPAVQALAQRVEIIEDPSLARFDACRLEIRPADAAPVVVAAAYGRGWPENPLDQAALERKFMLCCSLSASAAMRRAAPLVAARINDLAQAPCVAPLVNALAGSA
ncbi:MAG: MmgE/PrpD family protein [Achromobacter sp.]|nr:MmgE/PrpD family protein [Achromobacter sp.]